MDSNTKRLVGTRIRMMRDLRGLTTETLAEKLPWGEETVRRHMRGQTLGLDQIAAYSVVLQASIDWLLAPATGLEPVTYRFTDASTQGSAA